MTAPRSSPREREDPPDAARRAVQVSLAVALVALALAAPVRPQSDVEVKFGGGDSPCVAQVAGLVQAQVLWFDGIPFYERKEYTGDTHLYVTERGAPDPTNHIDPGILQDPDEDDFKNLSEGDWFGTEDLPLLVRSGAYYNFTDANGVAWNVTEAYMDFGPGTHKGGDGTGTTPTGVRSDEQAQAGTQRYYVWIVELDEVRDDEEIGIPSSIGDGGEYNFATRVNTSKFTVDTRKSGTYAVHEANSTPPRPEAKDGCHPDHRHTHRSYGASVWLGQEPDMVPLDCEPLYALSASTYAEYTFGGKDPTITASERGGTCTGINGTEEGVTIP